MDDLTVKIIPSDLPEEEKQRILWDVLEFLLHASQQNDDDEDKDPDTLSDSGTANSP